MFINTLPLRARLADDDTFRQLLQRVAQTVLAGLAHQQVPLQFIVQDVLTERDTSGSPLFQAMFIHERLPVQPRTSAGVTFETDDRPAPATMVDLSLELLESASRVTGRMNYRLELWEHSTIERLVGHFVTLLTGIAADADQRISDLPLLTVPERRQLLVEWNDTAVEYRHEKCVHQLFEQQVERAPDAVAVVFEDQELTYRNLNERANRIGQYLRRIGVEPGALVGLCLESSPELVVGILGVMKAGGAYVPLDADYPPQRLQFMLADAKVGFLVTQHSLLGRLPAADCQIVCLDAENANLDNCSLDNPSVNVAADNLAYVMYTSGSTGQPKGVQSPHSAVVNLLTAMAARPGVTSEDRLLSVTTPTFDISVLELLLPLTVGACLELLPSEVASDATRLANALTKEGVTVLQATPAMWLMLIQCGWNGSSHLKALCGGEAMLDSLARELKPRCRELWNMYGPTETTIWSTTHRVADGESPASIGRPIANTQVYVLDARRNPVPTGVPGELYIGGAGLARGYLNRPELTAERFVANPFSDTADARLYRTGDLCRWRADGNLEFLGRLDDQVKLRGFRIELGEIETALNEYPDVAQSVVILREVRPDDGRLVAYCVAADPGLNFSALKSHLRNRLLDYMMPAAFVRLDTLPLTSSGKVNRRALPAPDESRPELETGFVAPRTPIEQHLASIWCEILGIGTVGIHDNFFALGGHSLLATRVSARIASALQVDLPLRKLFESPTISELATEIDTLRSGGQSCQGTALKRVDRDKLPLSFAQQRLWFLEQLEGEATAYNMPFAWRLRGTLDGEALRRALEEVVRRHEPLRTTFAITDEEPVQLIGTGEGFELPLEDLSSLESEQQETEIVSRCRVEAGRPFDLTSDLMLRASLLRLADDEHLLLLTMHHIATDGWSLRVLWRELELLYDVFRRGADPDLPELAVQYADYAVWQRAELQGQRLEQLLQYWREQLQGMSVLELTADRPRPPVPTYQAARHSFELKEELVDQLRALGQAEGVTLHMLLLAAFQVLLARYSGQDDIAVGTPIAGRNHADLENQIGFFVNTLVLRTDLSEDCTFRELLGRVRQVSLAAYDYQDLPFEKLVEELQPQRHLSRSPLIQVLFQLLSFSRQDLALPGLELSRMPASSQRVRFDLEMHLWQQPKNLRGEVVYSTDLFDRATIERMVDHFVTLLVGIVTDADRRLSELPMLTEPERQQLLVEWNDTFVENPRERCVQEVFEEQVERTPASVAVVFEDQQLTYRKLNERANQLAHYLRSLGVGPESLVGLYMRRSPELVVGILGILKAGGAYVPLDVEYPLRRIQFMLADGQAGFLVTQHSLLDRLPANDCQVVCLDTDAPNLQDLARSNPAVNGGADNLAYVMYTSGSTGVPKGVAMPHSALVNLIDWHRHDPHLMQPARTLQFASCNFDVSFQEMLTTWCCGGTLVLISEEARRDPSVLWKIIVESRIERLFMPYVALQQLATTANVAAAGLRDIVSAGEALQLTPEIRHLLQGLSNCRLHNHYGPTESHVVTALILSDESATWPGEAPIGRPISNTQVYLLDKRQQPVPLGVPGELYIGGRSLSRGYLNRPELTADRFVANPFDDDPNSRLYRSGDLCRWRPDGNLEFLGRLDDQVKLRGFRIELGEIETLLNEHPSVALSVVVLREDRPAEKRLVAYCVPAADTELSVSKLRSHLRNRLPDYMLPAAFVVLDTLPLTSSGKVNRRVLPAPDDSRPELETGYVAPRNPIEQQVASIWCDVLGVETIGIHDNFFALGGHSLLATRVHARITSVLQVDLPLRRLFEAPTIAELSSEIETLRGGGLSFRGTALKRVDREQMDRLPLSFAQQRLWFLEQLEGELTAYNMPYAWRLRGTLDVEALRRALEAMLRRHEPLRTTFAMSDDEPVQVIGTGEGFELPLEDLRSFLSEQQETEIVSRCRVEAGRPFDLTSDLMLRASLLRLADDEHLLLLTMHHIASDGWSLRVLWSELELLYGAYCRGTNADLPDLTVQYADYAVWQRAELQGQRLEQLLPYWREQLQDVSTLELPTDRPRPPVPTYQAARHSFELKEELVDQLRALGQAEGVTLHMLLLAAFQVLLARYSGQDDIAVGTPIAGRNHAELENQIGFFVNTLVLRTDLSENPTFRQLLGRVRQVSLAAYDHQDLPFEKLVEELQPDRHLSRSPLFQVLFQLLSFSDKDLALADLEITRLPTSTQRVRFDLEMHLWQQPKKLRGAVVYSTDLFDASTIERLVGHFVTLLEEIVADADQRISELPLLTETERHQLLVQWNDTNVAYPRETCVHELFEQQVERTPDAVAVVFEDQELTYRELNERANQLAHYLRSRGVGTGTLVGLCLDRSLELVVGILGILKAGGAYVPLDAEYPPPRLEFMLADAQLGFLVTQQRLLVSLPSANCQIVSLDTDAAHLQDCARSNPPVNVAADGLAYVMYTSGSTGQPKGVAIRHTSIARLVFGNDYIGFGPDRVFLQMATVSFDASTLELWGSLLHGAKLVMAPVGLPDFQQLEDLLKRNRVTTLWLTATLFNQLVEHCPQTLNSVDEILTGGEALSVRHICQARAALGSRPQLINGYGPTESTTFTTCYRIPSQLAPELESIPIGRPIANTQAYVLDGCLQPVPIGVPGELYIGGAGLARGYLNRPELTTERFVANLFDDDPNSRLYRTGDLCRWRAEGNLEFLGRLDDQVKLRGYRIELGEIEAALNEHPDVAQSVVILREDAPGDKRLVAYCIPAADAALDLSQLRSHLRNRLPDYMVPAAFVALDALPLTPSGKINRRAMPAPDDSRPELETGYVAPRNAIEQQLAPIWCDVLGLDRIGVNDNFFELGGHSLMAVRLFTRIEQTFGRKLPLAVLFQHGTIGHLATLLKESSPATDIASVLPLQPDGDGRPLFLMPSIGGELLFSRPLMAELGGRFPVLGIQPALAAENLEQFRDLRTTAGYFVSALRTYQPHGPYALAGYSYGGLMAFEVACVLAELGEDVDPLVVIDTGPGRRGVKPQSGDRRKRLSQIAANLPSWLRDEFRQFSASRLAGSAARKLRRFFRRVASGGRTKMELDDVFDARGIPSQNQELMHAVFAAFRDYVPRPYAGRLTLFRASTRPLLSGYPHDLGWGRYVGALDIRQIKGNHESILHPPHVGELARQLGGLLDDLASSVPPNAPRPTS